LSHRYMGLSDLMKEIRQDPQAFLGDELSENKVLNQVLKLVEDKISEVKNQAVKWCANCCLALHLQLKPL
jgi:cullin-associated NEDD8-dissociated protein 1